MAGFSVELVGMAELIAKLEAMGPLTRVKVEKAVNAATYDGLFVAIDLSPVGNRKYSRNGESHPGFLKSRNQVAPLGWAGDVVVYELKNDAPYAIYLVFGTYKMRAQDFFTPAMAVARKSLVRRLAAIKIVD